MIPPKSRSYTSINSVDTLKRIDALIDCVEDLTIRLIKLEASCASCAAAPAKKTTKKTDSE